MPNAKIAVWLAGLGMALLLLLFVVLAVHAQAPADQQDGDDAIESQGLADPAPNGFSVIYTFTGARDIQYPNPENPENKENIAATVVHCTNIGDLLTQMRVEIYDYNDNYTLSVTEIITPNYTLTFTTQDVALYTWDAIIARTVTDQTSNIDQGSGRIMVDNPAANVICTAQVLDPLGNPPSYVVKLTLYDAYGNFAGDKPASVFLPVILKQ
jgi:hypothetical protein